MLRWTFAFVSICLTGCSFLDRIVAKPEPPTPSRVEIAKDSIITYVLRDLNGGRPYFQFGFGELYAHKPQSIIALDSLFEVKMTSRRSAKNDSDVDSLIEAQKAVILEQGDHTEYSMRHAFELKGDKEELLLAEYDFLLDYQFHVESMDPIYELTTSSEKAKIFRAYFYGSPLYQVTDYYGERTEGITEESLDLYDKMEEGLYAGQGTEERSRFLEHMLDVLQIMRKKQSFHEMHVLVTLGERTLQDNPEKFPGYKPKAWTSPKRIFLDQSSQDELIGYGIFHKFEAQENGKAQEQGCYMEFDKYYRLVRIDLLEPPVGKYF